VTLKSGLEVTQGHRKL